jgi:hypothetical protein
MFGGIDDARVLPLVVGVDYRGVAPGKYKVRFKRRARCIACDANGCTLCDRVGWTVRAESVDIALRRDAAIGSRMRLAGKGDDWSKNREGEVHVEVLEEGPRAVELRGGQELFEKALESQFARERREKRVAFRRGLAGLAVFALFLAGIAGLWLREYLDKKTPGEACAVDTDCRSHQCLALRRVNEGFGPLHTVTTTGHVCTKTCKDDGDCPSSMRCAAVHEGLQLPFATGHEEANALACVPRESGSARTDSAPPTPAVRLP